MATKTLTIMEDAYDLLKESKKKNESFSDVIRRIASKNKEHRLSRFFGILTEKQGDAMLKDLEMIKAKNRKMLKERIKCMY